MSAGHLLIVVIAGIASGCALSPSASHQEVRYYDLGEALSATSECLTGVQLGKVQSSPTLQGTRMWYRLADAPFEPIPYAISRWAAPAAELLELHMRPAFSHAGKEHVRLDLTVLRMELQVSSANRGRSLLELEASASSHGVSLGRRSFALSRDADASPAGAARSLADSIAQWPVELCAWLDSLQGGQGAL